MNSAVRSASKFEYAGRSGRRALGDVAAARANSAPVKSFQSTLERSKTGTSSGAVSLNATSSGRNSNSSVLAAIGANVSPVRQENAVSGGERLPSGPTRSTPPASTPDTPTTSNPNPAPAASPKFNALQQNWLDANTGVYANVLKANLSRSQPFPIDGVDIRWSNGSTGKPEFSQRAVGVVSTQTGKELAALFGGTLVQSPFETFGTSQRDQYIKLPNGQQVDASVLASQLNAARDSSDPFSATQSVLEIYRVENQNFNLSTSTNAIDLVTKGILNPGTPGNRVT